MNTVDFKTQRNNDIYTIALVAALMGTGCDSGGSTVGPETSSGTEDSNSGESQGETEASTEPDGGTRTGTQTGNSQDTDAESETDHNTGTDTDHNTGTDTDDGSGTETGNSGCRDGQTDCGGRCVDVVNLVSDCGGCGVACSSGEVCAEGSCQAAQWGTAARVADVERSRDPDVSVDSEGNALAVWMADAFPDGEGTRFDVWGARFDVDTLAWDAAVLLENTDVDYARFPQVAAAPQGDGVAIWDQDDRINFSRYDESGSVWSAPEVIEAGLAGAAQDQLLRRDAVGNSMAVWVQDLSDVRASRYDAATGGWTAPQSISTNSSGFALFMEMDSNASGDSVVVWAEFPEGASSNVWVNRYDADSGTWGTDELIENQDSDATLPQASIDDDGNVIVLWGQVQGNVGVLFSRRYDSENGSWEDAQMMQASAFDYRLDFDSQGNAVAVWRYQGQLWSQRYDVSTAVWQSATVISADVPGDVADPGIIIDPYDDAVVVWRQAGSVWANRFSVTDQTWGPEVELSDATNSTSFDVPQLRAAADGTLIVLFQRNEVLSGAGPLRREIWFNTYRAQP